MVKRPVSIGPTVRYQIWFRMSKAGSQLGLRGSGISLWFMCFWVVIMSPVPFRFGAIYDFVYLSTVTIIDCHKIDTNDNRM